MCLRKNKSKMEDKKKMNNIDRKFEKEMQKVKNSIKNMENYVDSLLDKDVQGFKAEQMDAVKKEIEEKKSQAEADLQNELQEKRNLFAERDKDLNNRENDLRQREEDYKKRDAELKESEDKISLREQEIAKKESDLAEKEDALAKEKARINSSLDRQKRLLNREKEVYTIISNNYSRFIVENMNKNRAERSKEVENAINSYQYYNNMVEAIRNICNKTKEKVGYAELPDELKDILLIIENNDDKQGDK